MVSNARLFFKRLIAWRVLPNIVASSWSERYADNAHRTQYLASTAIKVREWYNCTSLKLNASQANFTASPNIFRFSINITAHRIVIYSASCWGYYIDDVKNLNLGGLLLQPIPNANAYVRLQALGCHSDTALHSNRPSAVLLLDNHLTIIDLDAVKARLVAAYPSIVVY